MGTSCTSGSANWKQQGAPPAPGGKTLAAQLSVCWLRYEPLSLIGRADSLSDPRAFWTEPVSGACWRGDRPFIQLSVVKLFCSLGGVEAWFAGSLDRGRQRLRRGHGR